MTIQRALEIIKDEMPYESGVINEALNTVKTAVEKQIPKKPIKELNKMVCPNCKNSILLSSPYCRCCGQAIDLVIGMREVRTIIK